MYSRHIPRDFIQQLVERTAIEEIIGQRVKCKKRGYEYVACCPFHQEKNPSFTVSPQKNFYHCFGCGAHGNVIDFIMHSDNLEFIDAVKQLAQQSGIPIPESANGPDLLQPLRTLMNQAQNFYKKQLRISPKAIEYLKSRGIDGKTAKQFGIGFAPPGWNHLANACQLEKTNLLLPTLIKAGLCIRPDGKPNTYDRFRNRIMFPIYAGGGELVGFGGRSLSPDEPPKYLNSPETPLFHKGKVLYGLQQARKQHAEKLILVEGYMDVIALAQHEIHGAVACLGTALTPSHFQQMCRVSKHITLCFDGDKAGQRACLKACELLFPMMRSDVQCQIFILPNGEDPDSLVRKIGQQEFLKRWQQAPSFSEYTLAMWKKKSPGEHADQRAQFAHHAMQRCQEIKDDLFQASMLQEISKASEIDVAQLRQIISSNAEKSSGNSFYPKFKQHTKSSNAQSSRNMHNEENKHNNAAQQPSDIIDHILAWTITQPSLINNGCAITQCDPDRFPSLQLLIHAIDWIETDKNVDSGTLLSLLTHHPRQDIIKKLIHDIRKVEHPKAQITWNYLQNQLKRTLLDSDINNILCAGRETELNKQQRETLQDLIKQKQSLIVSLGDEE